MMKAIGTRRAASIDVKTQHHTNLQLASCQHILSRPGALAALAKLTLPGTWHNNQARADAEAELNMH